MRILPLLASLALSAQAHVEISYDGRGDLSVTDGYRDFAQQGFGPYDYVYDSILNWSL
jgi:hypothetical protein